jgi:exopolysaccharide/PEP-CTERM locus tyrosine autokinase
MSVVERAIEKLRRGSGQEPAKVPLSEDAVREQPIGTLSSSTWPETALADGAVEPTRRILIDRQAVREAGYLPEASQDRQFADHYRQIKRPLIAAAMNSKGAAGPGSPRLIMMASALPGDGKTFTSINLAFSMARERDTSVVLVDADVAKPHIGRIFGVDQELGLIEALLDNSIDIESLILPTDVRGLSILPAGKPHDGATELLASARMVELVTRIIASNPRRIVLFDSPPLLASSESCALAATAGQIVMVVRAAKTPRQAVLDALSKLGDERSVSLVLNQGRHGITKSYYGQGPYGSYGNDSAADE